MHYWSGCTVAHFRAISLIVPSLLHLSGIPVPPYVQGRILALADNMPESQGDGCGLTEQTGWKSLHTKKYHYVANADGTELLFDKDSDPNEYNDISGSSEGREVLYEMRALLIKRMLRIENPLKRDFPY